MTVIGVYVTSRYKNYEEFKATMDEALKKYIPTGKPNALCTGSSKSNNAGNGLVRRYAFELGIPCRVFETQWSEHIPTKPGKKNTAGVRANAMIVRNSTAAIMFYTPTSVAKWGFMSGGCYNFRKMCGKLRRELIPIKVDIYKPIEKPTKDVGDEAPPRADGDVVGDIGTGSRASELAAGGERTPPSAGFRGSVGGGVTTTTAPSPEASSTNTADGADIDATVPAQDTMEMPRSAGNLVNLPLDIDGDGTPDANIAAMDMNGDGNADSVVSPVDVNGDGTPDAVKIAPIDNVLQELPQQTTAQAAQQPPQTAQQPTSPAEKEKNQDSPPS